MVFVESKYQYIDNLKANTSLALIIDFIFFAKGVGTITPDLNNPQDVTNSLISSIHNFDEQAFFACYETFKKKLPDERSPWINNDYLLFFFLVASMKFKKDLDWLKFAISKRKRGLDNEKDLISDFFYNAVNGNLQSKGKYAPLSLCFKYFLDPTSIDKEDINRCLKEVQSYTSFPFYGSEFLNLLCLKSFDICLQLKDIKDSKAEERYRTFETIFLKRINLVSNILVYIILIAIIFFSYRLLMQVDEQRRNIITTVLSLVGLTALEFLKLRTILGSLIKKVLKSFFGYNTINEI